jgi:hypothetical protein
LLQSVTTKLLFQVTGIINQADNIKNSDFYKSLESTKKTCEKDGICDEDEIEQSMWERRKFALKTFIKDNRDALEEQLFD